MAPVGPGAPVRARPPAPASPPPLPPRRAAVAPTPGKATSGAQAAFRPAMSMPSVQTLPRDSEPAVAPVRPVGAADPFGEPPELRPPLGGAPEDKLEFFRAVLKQKTETLARARALYAEREAELQALRVSEATLRGQVQEAQEQLGGVKDLPAKLEQTSAALSREAARTAEAEARVTRAAGRAADGGGGAQGPGALAGRGGGGAVEPHRGAEARAHLARLARRGAGRGEGGPVAGAGPGGGAGGGARRDAGVAGGRARAVPGDPGRAGARRRGAAGGPGGAGARRRGAGGAGGAGGTARGDALGVRVVEELAGGGAGAHP